MSTATRTTISVKVDAVPDNLLSPNAPKVSNWTKGPAVAAERQAWDLATKQAARYGSDPAVPVIQAAERLTLHVTIAWPKGKRVRDDDNAWGMLKPARDAIAKALDVNDRIMRQGEMTQVRAHKSWPLGWVQITVDPS